MNQPFEAVVCAACKHRPSGRWYAVGSYVGIECCQCPCHDAADAGPALLAAAKASLAVAEHYEQCRSGCGGDLHGNVWYCPERNRLVKVACDLTAHAIALAEGQP